MSTARAAGNLGVCLNVGDEQLHRGQVRRNGAAQVFCQIGRKQARVLRAWRVDDQICRRDAIAQAAD